MTTAIPSSSSSETTASAESGLTWLYLAGLLAAAAVMTLVVQGVALLLAWSTEITTMPLSSDRFLRISWVSPLLIRSVGPAPGAGAGLPAPRPWRARCCWLRS